jgi:hypothetical protein
MRNLSSRLAGKPTLYKAWLLLLAICVNGLAIYPQSFKEQFEKGIRDDYWATEGLRSVTSDEVSISGKKAYRSYIPLGVHSNPRCEIRFRGANGTPNWHPHFSTWGVKFAIYIPKDFQPDPTSNEYLAQFHSVPDSRDTYNNPPWALRIRGTKLSVTNRWIEKKIASNANQTEQHWSIPGNVVPGKWHYFIVDIHWDYRSNGDGYMKFYMKVGSPPGKSDLKVNHVGPTGYNDDKGAYFKLGLYKWDWKSRLRVDWSKNAGVRHREVFYDDFEIKKNGFGPAAKVNKAPTADAGSDKTIYLPANKVVLKGSGTDPDGSIKKYRWTQRSGPSTATLEDENTRNLEASRLREGTYIFELTVEDDDGLKDSDEVKVMVEAPQNEPPVAKAGPDITIILPTNSVTIEGESSDPNDNIKSHRWTQKSGPSEARLEDADKATVEISRLKEGRYVFEYQVTDEEGEKDADRVVVNVEPPVNQPPVAKAGPDITITLPTNSVTIEGESSDPDDNIKSHKWTQKSGPSEATLEDANKATVKISKLKEGRYAFEYLVIDEEGERDADRVVVYVEPPVNQPPVAKAGPDITITLPTNRITIEGESSDPDDNIKSHKWTQKSGPSEATLEDADKPTVKISKLKEGRYAFEYLVIDEDGERDADRVVVYVEPLVNQPPIAKAGPNINITLPTNEITIDGGGTDPDDDELAYSWKQISGPSDADLEATNTATLKASSLIEGRYVFELLVTDETGEEDADRVVVIVGVPKNLSPTANAGPNINIQLPDDEISITGQGSDPDDGVSSFGWTQISGPSSAGIENADQATVTVTNLQQGRYVFELTVTDNSGETDSDRVVVSVTTADNQSPTANAGPDINLTLPVSSTVLKGSGSDPDDAVASFQWSQISGPTNATTSDLSKAELEVSNLEVGRYVFELQVIDQRDASDEDRVAIIVAEAQPVISADITNATCNADNGAIALNMKGGKAPYSYVWSNGAEGSTAKDLAPGTYEVEVTDDLGQVVSQSFKVNSKSVDLSVTSSIQNATCGSDNGSIKVQVSGGKAPYNFEWSTNGRTASLSKLSAGSYDLVVTDQNGCRKKVAFEVGVEAGEMNLDVSSQIEKAGCSGNGGSIALQAENSRGPLSFVWQHGATGSTLEDLAPGKYQVTITDEHGCFMKSDYTVGLASSPDKPIISQLADSMFVNQKNMQYQWYKDGQPITNATEQVLKISEGGRYWVEVSNDQSCTTSSDYFIADDPFFGVNEYLIRQVEFYPNPAINDLNVKLWTGQPAEAELSIYDLTGRIIKKQSLGKVSPISTHSISVRELPSGTYLIRAKADDEIVTRRFIKP